MSDETASEQTLTEQQRALLQARCKRCGGGSEYHYVGRVTRTAGNLEGKVNVGDILVEHHAWKGTKTKEIMYFNKANKLDVGEYDLLLLERIRIVFKTKAVKR